MNNDLMRLRSLIGSELDYDDTICAMIDEDKEVIIDDVKRNSNFEEYGRCSLYLVYYNDPISKTYGIWVDADNIIRVIS
jgi:hypothetical protein